MPLIFFCKLLHDLRIQSVSSMWDTMMTAVYAMVPCKSEYQTGNGVLLFNWLLVAHCALLHLWHFELTGTAPTTLASERMFYANWNPSSALLHNRTNWQGTLSCQFTWPITVFSSFTLKQQQHIFLVLSLFLLFLGVKCDIILLRLREFDNAPVTICYLSNGITAVTVVNQS